MDQLLHAWLHVYTAVKPTEQNKTEQKGKVKHGFNRSYRLKKCVHVKNDFWKWKHFVK